MSVVAFENKHGIACTRYCKNTLASKVVLAAEDGTDSKGMGAIASGKGAGAAVSKALCTLREEIAKKIP